MHGPLENIPDPIVPRFLQVLLSMYPLYILLLAASLSVFYQQGGIARNRILSQSSPLLTGPLHSCFLAFDRAWETVVMMIQSLSGRYFYYRVSGFCVETGKHTHSQYHLSIKSGGRPETKLAQRL